MPQNADTGYPSLATFSARHGYDKGRSVAWQAAWFAVQNMIFNAWWLPGSLRPRILRAFGASVGRNVFIRHRVRILWPWKLSIGNDTWIGEDAWLLNLEQITIGNDVCVSQGAFLCTGSHDHRSSDFHYDNAPIVVEDGAWIAAQALVLRGSVIGRGAVIGARAVITHSVPQGEEVGALTRY
ncbi:MAG TPA: hypothetical protein VGL75_06315 [Acidothermaceae bacterium]